MKSIVIVILIILIVAVFIGGIYTLSKINTTTPTIKPKPKT